jgi:hypothetical protein
MPGGLLNIVCYGCNDLYLTGAPQITFFKAVYRRYTNFSVESFIVAPNTNTNFNKEFEVIIPRYGDLLSKTYLAIEIPETYFNYNDFGFTLPTINSEIVDTDKTNYETVVEFMKYNTAAYRTIKRDAEVIGISTADISDNLYILINGDGQTARTNFHNLNSIDLSGTVDGLDIKYLLNTSDIYSSTAGYLLTDTSNNTVIAKILKTSEISINSSIKTQQYFYNKYRTSLDQYNLELKYNLKFNWNNNLAHNIIEYIDVYIGGEFIDRTEGEFLELYNQLTLKTYLEETYNKMIGNIPEMITYDENIKPMYTLYLPLQFWFTKNIGSAYPIIASQHYDIIIKIKFKNINLCGTIQNLENYTYTLEDLWNDKKYNLICYLLCDYIFLDTLERRKFAQSSHEYLIETVQSDYNLINTIDYTHRIDMKHPCKEFIFFFQKEVYRTDTTGYNINIFTNYSADINQSEYSMINCSLSLNGFDKVNKFIGTPEFYNLIQPYSRHTKIPTNGVYVYSNALVPEEIQPSGTLNLSRIKNILFTFLLNENMFSYKKSDINPDIVVNSINDKTLTTEVYFKIYAICYNVLRIKNGIAGLAFSAA